MDVIEGTEIKMNVSIEPIGELTMDSYDFRVSFYCSPTKKVRLTKEDAIRIDENNYLYPLDTGKMGVGHLKLQVEAQLPDGDFPDQLRTEILQITTDINVKRRE